MPEHVIGVDAGNSKTDVAVVSASGRLLARARGLGVDSPIGRVAEWRDQLVGLVELALADAGIRRSRPAAAAVYYLANVDVAQERRIARQQLDSARLARRTVIGNDTLAVLKAGASRPWGIAVVAGAGINAVGVHPSGRTAGFLALGDYTGDSGGGHDIGVGGLGGAVRHRDGRGPATVLTQTIPAFYGLRRPEDVAVAVLHGEIAHDDLNQLAPLVFAAAAEGDAVAVRIMAEFADEVVTMASALVRRLHLTRSDPEVVLGGGVLQAGEAWLLGRIEAGVTAVAPSAQVSVLDVSPVYGAVAEALRQAGATQRALLAARAVFSHAGAAR
jgi:N-acetylglucosamine kinase-like BadF-type ATPase